MYKVQIDIISVCDNTLDDGLKSKSLHVYYVNSYYSLIVRVEIQSL